MPRHRNPSVSVPDGQPPRKARPKPYLRVSAALPASPLYHIDREEWPHAEPSPYGPILYILRFKASGLLSANTPLEFLKESGDGEQLRQLMEAIIADGWMRIEGELWFDRSECHEVRLPPSYSHLAQCSHYVNLKVLEPYHQVIAA